MAHQVQGFMKNAQKKRAASPPVYVSPGQLTLEGFETPFSKKLNKENRWVKLADTLPWDEICNIYTRQQKVSQTGRPAISPRIVIGSLIIKHMCNLDDRETIAKISENMYMQYFWAIPVSTLILPLMPPCLSSFAPGWEWNN